MALLGQASGAFTESSSSLRILHVGIRNTVGVITDEAFEQTNPPVLSASGAGSTISDQVSTTIFGVLSGSVAFTRPDIDENVIGGPAATAALLLSAGCRPLGVFINHAAGYSFENTPAAASNKCPYVSAQGCYANSLFETNIITNGGTTGTAVAAVATVPVTAYAAGQNLVASVNGYLTNEAADGYEATQGGTNTIIGIVKMAPDNTQDELVYDQRI
jgi:hypothetical protein